MKFSDQRGLTRPPKGFTLIELMVVVAIIAVLAALIVPGLQKAQTAAMGRACMSKIKVIPVSLRAYSASWDGWTNPVQDYYLHVAGFQLESDPDPANSAQKMNQRADWPTTVATQALSKDWICPVDSLPTSTLSGVRTSYKVAGDFLGKNLMALEGAANRILAAKELGTRHPTTVNAQTVFNKHYSFADGSVSLGATGLELPGVTIRYFNVGTTATIQVAEGSLPTPVIEDNLSSGVLGFNFREFFIKASAKVATIPDWKFDQANGYDQAFGNQNRGPRGDGHYSNAKCPVNLVVRVDGVMKFPASGKWFFGGSNDMFRRSGQVQGAKMFAISGTGKGDAMIAGSDLPDTTYTHWGEHNTGRNAAHKNRYNAGQGVTVTADTGKPFHKFWVIFPFPTAYTHYDRYGGFQGIEWFHPNPANNNDSDYGNSQAGEVVPLQHCYSVP